MLLCYWRCVVILSIFFVYWRGRFHFFTLRLVASRHANVDRDIVQNLNSAFTPLLWEHGIWTLLLCQFVEYNLLSKIANNALY